MRARVRDGQRLGQLFKLKEFADADAAVRRCGDGNMLLPGCGKQNEYEIGLTETVVTGIISHQMRVMRLMMSHIITGLGRMQCSR
jgi:hypothetical protein